MNDAGPGGVPSGGEPGGRLSRRNLLWLFGGVAGSSFLTTRLWQGVASAGGAEVSPTIPEPSLPAPALTPPDTPTAADVAAGLNWDVDALFRFVADDVRYDPYAGALRGSVGTLWGMAGNSTDQALLLASLLDEAVVPYRFVIGELADSAATDLVASAALDVESARQHAAKVLLPPDVAEAWSGEGPWTRTPEIDEILAAVRGRVNDSVRRDRGCAGGGWSVCSRRLRVADDSRP